MTTMLYSREIFVVVGVGCCVTMTTEVVVPVSTCTIKTMHYFEDFLRLRSSKE